MHRRLDPLPSNTVQLIDEDDTGGICFCLLCKTKKTQRNFSGFIVNCFFSHLLTSRRLTEKVPDAAGTNTHKHLIKLGSRGVVERHVSLSSYGSS